MTKFDQIKEGSLKRQTWQLLRTKYHYFLWGTPLLFVIFVPLGLYLSKTYDYNPLWFFLGPAVPLFALCSYLYTMVRQQFYKDYAASIGFSYSSFVIPNKFEGSLFREGNARTIQNLIKGNLNGKDTEIFDYTYTTGSGKHKQSHDFTIVEITFYKQLPFFALREKGSIFSGRPTMKVRNGVKVELEGDFYKHFDLEVEKDFEIETLQIFTPDMMAELCDKWSHLSLETSDDRLYIYENRHIETKAEMDSLINLAKMIITKLSKIEDHLSRDVSALRNIINSKK